MSQLAIGEEEIQMRLHASVLIITLLVSSCSSPNDASDACGELSILINQLEKNELKSMDVFHETVDAILVHAREASKNDGEFSQLANKIQTFASMWYAEAGNKVPTSSEVEPLKDLWNSYCKTIN